MKRFFLLLLLGFTSLNAQTSYNVSLYGHINKYGANPSASNYSEVWGWTDTVKNREYAFIGSPQGTSVVDITEKPIKEVSLLIGPTTSNSYKYHEFRTYKNYLYIGSEGTDINRNAGIQIVDLSTLPDSATFKKVHIWVDTNSTTGALKNYYRAHTVSIEKNFLYVNGGDFGGTRILDLSDPLNPLQVGSYGKGSTPYVHDAFIKNDTLYAAAINAGRLDIVDLTTKKHLTQNSIEVLSKTPTVPEGRTHQVWLSEDGNFAFVATEIPNSSSSFIYNLHVYNITNRKNPIQIATWTSNPKASIHNVFVKEDYLYIGYYSDGFRVLDISNPYDPIEVAFYKTYFNPNPPLFAGAWGVYPYFPSGKIAVSDMNTGLYVFNVDLKKGGNIIGIIRDATTNAPIGNAQVTVLETGRTYLSAAGSGIYKYGNASGLHNVIFTKAGYISDTLSITTPAGTTDTVFVNLQPASSVSVEEINNVTPTEFRLEQNFPNPFNPETVISYQLPITNNVTLKVFNVLGKEVATLVNEQQDAGSYNIKFDGKNLPSGIYYCRLQTEQYSEIKKMVLIK